MPTSAAPLQLPPHIETLPEHEAHGATQAMYRQTRDHCGYLPNMTAIFSHRPNSPAGPEHAAAPGRLIAGWQKAPPAGRGLSKVWARRRDQNLRLTPTRSVVTLAPISG